MRFYRQNRCQETVIGKIPTSWEAARLRDVAEYVNGYAFKPSDWGREGLPIIRIQNLNDPNAGFNYFRGQVENKYIVESGDLLFSWSASIGAFLWKGSKAVLNQHIFKVVPNKRVAKFFLYYALFLAIKQLGRRVHGSTMKHFKRGELDTLIPLPPLAEQTGIAEILSTFDEAIDKTDKIILKTERLKRFLMQELLTRGIGHKEFKDTEIGRIPMEWDVTPLRDVANSYKNGIYKPPEYYGQGYPCIRMYNIVSGRINKIDATLLDVTERELDEYSLQPGDILVNRVNTAELVGKAGVVPEGLGKATFESKNIRVRLDKTRIVPEFLSVFVQTAPYARQIFARAKTAVAQATIIQDDIGAVLLPLPSIIEQRKIAEIVSAFDRKIDLERSEKGKADRIKKALMDLLLTGKVRVRVD